jgi:glucose/mannose-6-phosphate isomerase
MTPLDQQAVAAYDSTGQFAEALGLAEHLRDALWRVDSAGIAPFDAPRGLVIAGMGGSAIGGALAQAGTAGRGLRPINRFRGYGLPQWIGAEHCVLLSSYSGCTEETLSCYDDAKAKGACRIVCTTGGPLAERARRDGVPVVPVPGGFQPRAAVGYATVVALEIARLCGAAPDLRGEIELAAARVEREARAWAPEAGPDAPPKALARELLGTVPVVAGADAGAAAGYRWKSQINENASLAAFATELPEADHNEICGWQAAEAGRLSLVLLETGFEHPRNALRIEATGDIVRDAGVPVHRVRQGGEAPLEALMALVLFGDLVSLYLAVLRGVDPVDITAIDRLKAVLQSR